MEFDCPRSREHDRHAGLGSTRQGRRADSDPSGQDATARANYIAGMDDPPVTDNRRILGQSWRLFMYQAVCVTGLWALAIYRLSGWGVSVDGFVYFPVALIATVTAGAKWYRRDPAGPVWANPKWPSKDPEDYR
jgi:hypothetical protein